MTMTMNVPDKAYILQAIDIVTAKCVVSQQSSPDMVVGQELAALQKVRHLVAEQWPLSQDVKAALNIGPVAAKNIADWNDELATSLMVLHHVLKNDGDGVLRLLQPVDPRYS